MRLCLIRNAKASQFLFESTAIRGNICATQLPCETGGGVLAPMLQLGAIAACKYPSACLMDLTLPSCRLAVGCLCAAAALKTALSMRADEHAHHWMQQRITLGHRIAGLAVCDGEHAATGGARSVHVLKQSHCDTLHAYGPSTLAAAAVA